MHHCLMLSILLKEAWDLVHPVIIKNCFSKGGFVSHAQPAVKVWMMQMYQWLLAQLKEYVNDDCDLEVAGELTLQTVRERS